MAKTTISTFFYGACMNLDVLKQGGFLKPGHHPASKCSRNLAPWD